LYNRTIHLVVSTIHLVAITESLWRMLMHLRYLPESR